MKDLSYAPLLLTASTIMILLSGCFWWPNIRSSGIKRLKSGDYYVNVESDYDQIDELLKTAHDAATYECIAQGREMVVLNNQIIGFSNVQLIFACIESDEPEIRPLPAEAPKTDDLLEDPSTSRPE